jgi:hypothetical protein
MISSLNTGFAAFIALLASKCIWNIIIAIIAVAGEGVSVKSSEISC